MPQEIVVIRAMPQTGDVDGSQGVGVDGDYQAGFRLRIPGQNSGLVSFFIGLHEYTDPDV